MALQLGFLRTRVGRRFLTGNLLSAFVPLAAITLLSIIYLRSELRDEAEARVTRLSKSLTLSVLSALTDARRELRNQPFAGERIETTSSRFLNVVRRDASHGVPLSPTDSQPRRPFSDDEVARLGAGQVVLVVSPTETSPAILLARPLLPWREKVRPVAWVELNPTELWGSSDETIGGEEADYCVFETGSLLPLHCTSVVSREVRATALDAVVQRDGTRATAVRNGFYVSTRDVYLRHELGAAEWRVVVLQRTEIALNTLRSFVRVSVLLMVGMAVVIFLVSHTQIRRTTEPLARLQEGTRRLQAGDFTTPVVVTSKDEYAEVATSFNGMARALDRQLLLLRNIDAVDRAALTGAGTREVIDEALGRFCSSLTCSRVTIAVVASAAGRLDVSTIDPRTPVARSFSCTLSPDERRELLEHPRQLLLVGSATERSYVAPAERRQGDERILVLPLVHDTELVGLIALTDSGTTDDHTAHCEEARRLADRVSLALSHVLLMGQLHALSVGTLTAFARAIDANSPWTAGHSERVTRVALTVGQQLGLSPEEMTTLERGGLLHDVGKIAVSAAILDKQDPLDAQEWRIMRQHPVVGYEILTPIPAFADALPIVRSHHERMDGSGYPDGLVGEDIPWLARILAVADVFDAMVSDRPYRAGMPIDAVSRVISAGAGTEFDTRVVLAFLDAMRQGRIRVENVSNESSLLAAKVAHARGVHATAS